jgi:hypothetical protein
MKTKQSGRYKCLHCGGYFDCHEDMSVHLWEEMVYTDQRFKAERGEWNRQ